MKREVIHGDICYTPSPQEMKQVKDGYIIVEDGIVKDVCTTKPEGDDYIYSDYSGKMIIPGMSDLHAHAPQYSYTGLGMDMELLDWLNTYTFPEESKYSDMGYAKKAYDIFAEDVLNTTTTRIVCFATIHMPATLYLMEKLDSLGIKGYVGRVNMDRNAQDSLLEPSSQAAIDATREFIINTRDKFENIKPIITPRFTPSCTDETMYGLGSLAKEYGIRVQSHISENPSEVAWVKELCPWSSCYADTYYKTGLLGSKENPAIMAHCVYSMDSDEEMRLLQECGIYIAHCPQSNINVSSGIAPIREFMDLGMNIGLGSDVAGGSSLDIRRAVVDAIGVSKLRWRIMDNTKPALTPLEGLYLATKGWVSTSNFNPPLFCVFL